MVHENDGKDGPAFKPPSFRLTTICPMFGIVMSEILFKLYCSLCIKLAALPCTKDGKAET